MAPSSADNTERVPANNAEPSRSPSASDPARPADAHLDPRSPVHDRLSRRLREPGGDHESVVEVEKFCSIEIPPRVIDWARTR
jgi:hypothetical protein